MQARLNEFFDLVELVIKRLDSLAGQLHGLIVKVAILLLAIVGAYALLHTQHC